MECTVVNVLFNHLRNCVKIEADGFDLNGQDYHDLKCLIIQLTNASSLLALEKQTLPFSLHINENRDLIISKSNRATSEDAALAYRFSADAMERAFHLDFDLLSRSEHPALEVGSLLASWRSYLSQIEQNNPVELLDTVTHLSIELFSTVIHKPVPYVLQKEVAQELYVNKMGR